MLQFDRYQYIAAYLNGFAPISVSVGMSRSCYEQNYFYYLAIRQANSTTVDPSAAATTDVTIPPLSARSAAM